MVAGNASSDVEISRDLSNFGENSYFDVECSEMRPLLGSESSD